MDSDEELSTTEVEQEAVTVNVNSCSNRCGKTFGEDGSSCSCSATCGYSGDCCSDVVTSCAAASQEPYPGALSIGGGSQLYVQKVSPRVWFGNSSRATVNPVTFAPVDRTIAGLTLHKTLRGAPTYCELKTTADGSGYAVGAAYDSPSSYDMEAKCGASSLRLPLGTPSPVVTRYNLPYNSGGYTLDLGATTGRFAVLGRATLNVPGTGQRCMVMEVSGRWQLQRSAINVDCTAIVYDLTASPTHGGLTMTPMATGDGGNQTVDLGDSTDRACFLTGVRESDDDKTQCQILERNDSWYLETKAGYCYARCVTFPSTWPPPAVVRGIGPRRAGVPADYEIKGTGSTAAGGYMNLYKSPDGTYDKPVMIVGGFNPKEDNGTRSTFFNLAPLLMKLSQMGGDIWYVKYSGAADIRVAAFETANAMNRAYHGTGTGFPYGARRKPFALGLSQGGLVLRVALASWEQGIYYSPRTGYASDPVAGYPGAISVNGVGPTLMPIPNFINKNLRGGLLTGPNDFYAANTEYPQGLWLAPASMMMTIGSPHDGANVPQSVQLAVNDIVNQIEEQREDFPFRFLEVESMDFSDALGQLGMIRSTPARQMAIVHGTESCTRSVTEWCASLGAYVPNSFYTEVHGYAGQVCPVDNSARTAFTADVNNRGPLQHFFAQEFWRGWVGYKDGRFGWPRSLKKVGFSNGSFSPQGCANTAGVTEGRTKCLKPLAPVTGPFGLVFHPEGAQPGDALFTTSVAYGEVRAHSNGLAGLCDRNIHIRLGAADGELDPGDTHSLGLDENQDIMGNTKIGPLPQVISSFSARSFVSPMFVPTKSALMCMPAAGMQSCQMVAGTATGQRDHIGCDTACRGVNREARMFDNVFSNPTNKNGSHTDLDPALAKIVLAYAYDFLIADGDSRFSPSNPFVGTGPVPAGEAGDCSETDPSSSGSNNGWQYCTLSCGKQGLKSCSGGTWGACLPFNNSGCSCGNGVCDPGEDCPYCTDCAPGGVCRCELGECCGDGTCQAEEQSLYSQGPNVSCYEDCTCNQNYVCDTRNERGDWCPYDCYCGDGVCMAADGETNENCPSDCRSGGGGSCFLAGTQVTMADGSIRSIEDIRIGDFVMSYDETTHRTVASRVIDTIVHETRGDKTLVINGTIRSTVNHPFYSDGKWVLAKDLTPGDRLLALAQSAPAGEVSPLVSTVVGVDVVPGRATVYNLEVEGTHTYFAEGVLVHNAPRHEAISE
ncbi:MAG: polymorphic toxin-type HINT domain-containing protein [Kofleriaceae bacterium]